ncbi:hypothetical protein [Acidianus manzaensis]|uniref:hypothetical protein n=1 Tax=Acidianus manzaensis TaxID=282676 RepID=UPI00164FF9D2|nr:hypothetical protein [Acidianus manzaensis]
MPKKLGFDRVEELYKKGKYSDIVDSIIARLEILQEAARKRWSWKRPVSPHAIF